MYEYITLSPPGVRSENLRKSGVVWKFPLWSMTDSIPRSRVSSRAKPSVREYYQLWIILIYLIFIACFLKSHIRTLFIIHNLIFDLASNSCVVLKVYEVVFIVTLPLWIPKFLNSVSQTNPEKIVHGSNLFKYQP